MLGAHREPVPPNQLSPALPLLEKQARFRVPSDAASRPTAGVPLQTPQALMRAMHINSRPLCADRAGCQAEFFVTIFCGPPRCESLPTFRVAKVFRRALHVEKLRTARRKPLSRNKNST
jgi:hypothetical protein